MDTDTDTASNAPSDAPAARTNAHASREAQDSRAPAGASRRLPARGGFGLGRWLGVEVRVDWSLFIVFALILLNLGSGVFPRWHPGWTPALAWGVAAAAALLFIGSILLHELSHALVARRYGIAVDRITLFLFGGLAHLEGEPPSPKSELLMAAAGPLVSIAIGLGASVCAGLFAQDVSAGVMASGDAAQLEASIKHAGPVATLLFWLGPINLIVGVFNLVPGFPLDGGRVLRALLWWGTGNLVKATRWSAAVGSFVAWALVALGVMQMFGGMLVQGLWLVLIGWFLHSVAQRSYQQLLTRQLLHDVPVRALMWTQPPRLSPETTVERFVEDYVIHGDQRTAAVQAGARLLGIVTFDDARNASRQAWSQLTVADIMTPATQLPSLPTDARAERALDALAQRDIEQIPIMDGSELRGVVRRSDLVRWIALQNEHAGAA